MAHLLLKMQMMLSVLRTDSPSGELPPPGGKGNAAGISTRRSQCRAGFTIAEVLTAIAILVMTTVAVTTAMLQINRQAAIIRLVNAAKAQALSRIQRVAPVSYNPDANPAIIPSILNTGTTTEAVDLGDATTGLGSVSGTSTWIVAMSGTTQIRSVRCRIDYRYYGRNLSYELFTYKAPD
jgi:hypothetical protein